MTDLSMTKKEWEAEIKTNSASFKRTVEEYKKHNVQPYTCKKPKVLKRLDDYERQCIHSMGVVM